MDGLTCCAARGGRVETQKQASLVRRLVTKPVPLLVRVVVEIVNLAYIFWGDAVDGNEVGKVDSRRITERQRVVLDVR